MLSESQELGPAPDESELGALDDGLGDDESFSSTWNVGDAAIYMGYPVTITADLGENQVTIKFDDDSEETVDSTELTWEEGESPITEPDKSGLKVDKNTKVWVEDSDGQWKARIISKNDDGTWKIEWTDDNWDGIGQKVDVVEGSIEVKEQKRGSRGGGRRRGRSSKKLKPQYSNTQEVKDIQQIIGAPSCDKPKGCDGYWQDNTQAAWSSYVGKKIDALGSKWSDKKSKIQTREGGWLNDAATLAEKEFGTGITGALKFVTWLGDADAAEPEAAGPPDSSGATGELDDNDVKPDPPVEVEVPAVGAQAVNKAKSEKVKKYPIKTKAGVKIGAVYAKPSHVEAGGQRGWWGRIGRADFKLSFKRDMPWGADERFITDWGGNNVNIPLSKIKYISFEDEYKEGSGKGAYKIKVVTWDGSAEADLEWSPPKGSVRVKSKK